MINVAAVGCGTVMQEHYRHLSAMPGVALVGHCDIELERAATAAKTYGGKAYTGFEKMFEETRPNAAYICVPPFARGEVEEAAAAQGIHLFLETPVAVDAATASRIGAAVRTSKIITSAGYQHRYCDTVNRARQLLKGKAVSLVSGVCLGGLPDAWWWRQREKSGGQFLTQTTLAVDLMRYLCGEVSEVFALGASGCMNQVKDYDIEDSSTVIMRLKSGAAATFASTCVNGRHGRLALEIITPEATFTLEDGVLQMHQDHTTVSQRCTVDRFAEQTTAFIDAVRTGKRNGIRSTFADARKTLLVTLAANESMASGLAVRP
jgi:predicted dehydrogenase